MSRYRPSELQGYLRSLGVKPIKGLSQNFLIDGNILDKIIALAEVTADDCVVEIGPGPGALTQRLLETGCEVIAIELDPIFAKALPAHPRLTVHAADALKFDFNFDRKIKVVANLPYAITTQLLEKIVTLDNLQSATVMVQDEVARRLCFECSSKDYVAFTIFLQYYCKPKYGFSVSPSCFYPAPRVTSAVMRLDIEKRYKVADEAEFFRMVHAAFAHKRKMLKATLKEWFPNMECTKRPEDLSTQEWAMLANSLS